MSTSSPNEEDDKIMAVHLPDPDDAHYTPVVAPPAQRMREVQRGAADGKALEQPWSLTMCLSDQKPWKVSGKRPRATSGIAALVQAQIKKVYMYWSGLCMAYGL